MSLVSGVLSLVLVAFSVWAVVDVFLTPKESIRNFHKIVWLVPTVLFGPVAGVLWLWLGRPRGVGFLPGGNTGPIAQVVDEAGIADSDHQIASADSGETTGFESYTDESPLEDPVPEATTVVDLTESIERQPAPLGPEDSEGWAEWATKAVAEMQAED